MKISIPKFKKLSTGVPKPFFFWRKYVLRHQHFILCRI
uniref:Uncharacterized protein n=1 Tax=Arundo donax TaxID=35708 RepID=A0A0A9C6S3_ARUDO